jgi:hypothetical protein
VRLGVLSYRKITVEGRGRGKECGGRRKEEGEYCRIRGQEGEEEEKSI